MNAQITVYANSISYSHFLKNQPWKWKGSLTNRQNMLELEVLPHILGN